MSYLSSPNPEAEKCHSSLDETTSVMSAGRAVLALGVTPEKLWEKACLLDKYLEDLVRQFVRA